MPGSRDRSRFSSLIIEMVSIVFAVLLALAVSNWDLDRQDRKRAHVALDRIRMELERDSTGVAAAAPYYNELGERLDSILRTSGDQGVRDVRIPGWRGLSPPALRTASYQVATATGTLEHVDFALADEIALTYDILDDFSAAIDHALSTLMSGNLTRVSEWQVVFNLLTELAYLSLEQTRRALAALSVR